MYLRKNLLFLIFLSGCASTTHGSAQRILIVTPGVPAAQCKLFSQALGTVSFSTPEVVEIPRSSDPIEVSCKKKCFVEAHRVLSPRMNSEELASNSFLGVVPVIFDLATQKHYGHPYEISVLLRSNNRCVGDKRSFLDGEIKGSDVRIDDFSFDDF